MLPIFLQFLGLLLNLLGISQQINQKVQRTSQETTDYLIQDTVKATNDIANSGVYGNIALHLQLSDIQSSLAMVLSGISPVTLPTTPPSGYGTPSSSTIGDAVWNYEYGSSGRQTGTWLEWAGSGQLREWVVAVDLPYGAYWSPLLWVMEDPGSYTANYPTFNPGDLVAGESFLDCITRQNPGADVVSQFYPMGQIYCQYPNTATLWQWVSTIDETYYDQIMQATFGVNPQLIPPVWPGIAKVTLGTPVAISSQFSVSGPMDGLIIAISGVSTSKPELDYDTQAAYKFIGGLSFVDDNGDVEPFQPLAFKNAVYCPRQMASAAAAVFRVDPSVSGTVTPWVTA
jgi:hypothetical protein